MKRDYLHAAVSGLHEKTDGGAIPLRPCPFCGTAHSGLGLLNICQGFYAITCDRCGAIGPNAFSGTDAGTLWNTIEGKIPESGV